MGYKIHGDTIIHSNICDNRVTVLIIANVECGAYELQYLRSGLGQSLHFAYSCRRDSPVTKNLVQKYLDLGVQTFQNNAEILDPL